MKAQYLCIPLRGKRGGIALISESARNLVDGYNWYQTEGGYAFSPKVGLMHRRVMAAETTECVDHKNFNRLDNRYENLRCCLPEENNKRISKRDTPWPYKGVRKLSNRWFARIQIEKKAVHLGAFDTAEEAARAFDAVARPLGRVCNFGEPS